LSWQAIEEALWTAARQHLPQTLVGGSALTAAVIDRSRRYTSERARLDEPANVEADLAARALFFTMADAAKPRLALAELGARVPWERTLRVLDLGAGVGAMTLGVLAHAAERGGAAGIDVEAVDRDGRALAILSDAVPAAARALGVACKVTTSKEPFDSALASLALRSGQSELVLIGSVLNEMSEEEAGKLVRKAMGALAPGGAVIIVEPALRAQARALHRLRDDALTGAWAHVFAPCTRGAAPCPMLADERDWCHEERLVQLPPRAAKLAQITGLRDGGLKFSYLVLRNEPGHVGADGAVRVVSHPLISKGKHEAFVCGDDGRVRLRLLKRHRSEANRAFERARRGAVLRLGDAPDNDLVSGTIVERLDEPDRDH
jgi:ribosomal protein RSM22 (predicted rRNA methylase)